MTVERLVFEDFKTRIERFLVSAEIQEGMIINNIII